MNINQLKAFLGDKPQHLGKENSLQNQLRESGLRQALSVQNNQGAAGADKFSSSVSLGVAIYSNSFNSALEINLQKPDFSTPKSKESESSLFDFEEVAKNVLNFVGGAIKNAKNKGADTTELNALFEQATSGVLKGIKLAEKDLAGFLNEEIANGISQSKALIDDGINKLRQDIFAPKEIVDESSQAQSVTNLSVEYEKQQFGELNIRTRDGDSVKLSFEDIQQFEFKQQQFKELAIAQENDKLASQAIPNSEINQSTDEPLLAGDLPAPNKDSIDAQDVNVVPSDDNSQTSTKQTAVYYQQNSLSFSIQGELDEDELKAIGQLVADTNELAEEFFNGDIEKAFNQALELGFDEKELASFALQLTKVENTQVIKAYETVSHFDEDNVESDPAKAVKPVTDYLNKLLNVLDASRLQLEDNKSYENVVNELINRLGDDVATPDLISAINRFNEFNQRLVNNLPIGFQPEA